jgi:hypothetical protein
LTHFYQRWKEDSRSVEEVAASVNKWLDAVQSLVIGPGLSRDEKIQVLNTIVRVIRISTKTGSASKIVLTKLSLLGNSSVGLKRSQEKTLAHRYRR